MSRAQRWAKKGKELGKRLSFDKVEYLDLKPGQNILRIIPPFGDDDDKDFWKEVQVSYNVGPNEKMIVRPDQYGKPDPVADEIAKLRKLGDEASVARADAMGSKTRCYIFVIDREEPEKGYQLWNANQIILNEILAIFGDPQYGDITDPENGVDITVNYTPGTKKKFPKWHINPRRHSSPLDHPEALEVDLFEKHNVGEPSEIDYIKACLEGSEEEFKAARKKERAAAEADGDDDESSSEEGNEEEESEEGEEPENSEDDAIKKKAEELKKKAAAKKGSKGKGGKKPPAAPKKDKAPPPPKKKAKIGTPKELLEQQWWVVVDGESVEKSGAEVQSMLDEDSTTVEYVTSVDDPGDWQTAEDIGFIPDIEQSQVGSDLEGAVSG
jgi:hypothetical protein